MLSKIGFSPQNGSDGAGIPWQPFAADLSVMEWSCETNVAEVAKWQHFAHAK